MTVAVCTNCGKLKHGAWCSCPACESLGLDGEVGILLSDHNLSEAELERIGDAVGIIHNTGLDEETRFHLLVYYLSRKWPKLLEYDIDAVELKLQKSLDALYRSNLAHLPGQEEPDLKVSPIHQRTWASAMGASFQEEDDAWQAEARGLLLDGMKVAKQIVALKIEAGEGAVLQRLTHSVKTLFHGCDYRRLAARSTELIGDAKEYQRTVNTFCARVRNGWSDRTKEQAAYFRGLCQRLEEIANRANAIIEHKAGINRLIDMDFKRLRQEFAQSYKTFIDLSYVVLDPRRIDPDGTCRRG
jgi:hypothetical protein